MQPGATDLAIWQNEPTEIAMREWKNEPTVSGSLATQAYRTLYRDRLRQLQNLANTAFDSRPPVARSMCVPTASRAALHNKRALPLAPAENFCSCMAFA
jgi:hypothetical protein